MIHLAQRMENIYSDIRGELYREALRFQNEGIDVLKLNTGDLLRGTNILVVPGSGFDWPEHDHMRLVMLPQAQELRDAMLRIGKSLENYRQI